MPVLLPLIALAAAAQPGAQPGPAQQQITVVGRRASNLKSALEACLARHCPPDQDIDATLAYAEELFVAGDYHQARGAIKASLGRNKDEAARYPEPVSGLYRADARVSRHLGLDADAQRSTFQILNALKAGLPKEDYRHFTARLEIASSALAFGRFAEARRQLRELARSARTAGRDDVVQVAELRLLWVDYVEFPSGPSRDRIIEASRSTDPARAITAAGAKTLLAQIYREQGDIARSDAVLAQIRNSGARRRLLYAPPYELTVRDISSDTATIIPGNVLNRLSDNFEKKWIDVAFRILPDGRVADLEILRKGGDSSWAAPLLNSIRGRRYAASADSSSTDRVERYSYTAGYEDRTGSHIQQRSPRARVEYLDLTTGGDPAPPSESRN